MATPLDPQLYERAKREIYARYDRPSAYRSAALVKRYKELGGRYTGPKPRGGLDQWFREAWRDVGGPAPYPVYRPTKRVAASTPLTVQEIDPKNLRQQIAKKQQIKGTANLPPFKAKRETKLKT